MFLTFYFQKRNVSMYAGAHKIAQELFFWGYHLRVCSSNGRKYFAVQLNSSASFT